MNEDENLTTERVAPTMGGDEGVLARLSVSLAHHLRNPLASIGANIEILLEMLAEEDPRRVPALQVLDETHRMSDLVGDVVHLTSRNAVPRKPTSLLPLIEDVADGFGAAIRDRGASMQIEIAFDEGEAVFLGDSEIVREALTRVVRNAVEVVGEDGRIVMTVGSCTGGFCVTVEDSGPGIARGDRNRVFSPLVSTKARGLGLGLTFARQALESIGGRIDLVSSSSLGGACFRIELPGCSESVGGVS